MGAANGGDLGCGCMDATRVPYDEFAYFADNASEFGIAYTGPPSVRRESVEMADGRSLSALVWGSAEPELVLIHGGAQNAHTWDTVCLALDKPLIAIDMPGHGHSDAPADGPANVVRNAQDIAVVIRSLAPTARTVVGMSLGGLTTMALSAQRGILHNAEQRDDGSWVWRHARHNVFSELPSEDATSPTGSPKPPSEDATSPVGAQESPASGSADPHDEAHHAALWEAIENHDGPVVLARGMREQSVVDDADEAELRRRRPDARIEHFVEAGHSIQGDMPVELATLIADVLGDA